MRQHSFARRAAAGVGTGLLAVLVTAGAVAIGQRLFSERHQARAALDDGSALRALQDRLAPQRLCARVLDGVQPFKMYGDSLSLPSVKALIAAGLIEPVPAAERPADARYPLYRMSAAAAPYLREDQLGTHRLVSLCYGKPQVEELYLGEGGSRGWPMLRFTYSVQDRPDWADRDDIRDAFPFLNELTTRPLLAWNRISFDGARPLLRDVEINPMMDVRWGMGEFSYCPPLGFERTGACARTD